MRAKIENMISPDYVLCFIPRANGNFRTILKVLDIFLNFGKFCSCFWIISNYNFQIKRNIMTAGGVYWPKTLILALFDPFV